MRVPRPAILITLAFLVFGPIPAVISLILIAVIVLVPIALRLMQ
jgi:hypothetical protein